MAVSSASSFKKSLMALATVELSVYKKINFVQLLIIINFRLKIPEQPSLLSF